MPDWKIIITDGLHQNGQDILKSASQVDDRSGISLDELAPIISTYDAMVVRSRTKVSSAMIEAAERLQVIGRTGVGVDNIDLAAASAHGVTVVNTPTSTTQAVAEQALALMFALARSIPRADAAMKSGLWIKKELQGIELNGKVLGIIGVGNIGSTVARLASTLGMSVIGYDALVPPDEIRARGLEPVDLPGLLSRSDFISLHVPLNPETRNLINGQTLGLMKRGVRLVCTARGGVIDETALLGALESGQVAGAALDVFAKEPPGMIALVAHPQVITTPHISAQTAEAQARAAVDITTEILAALRGEVLRWKIV